MSESKSVIVIWKRNEFDDVDIYKRLSTPRLPMFTCRNNVGKKSIR